MRPKAPVERRTEDLFRHRLENMIDMRHELVAMAGLLEWRVFEEAFGAHYSEGRRCPGKPVRLMVGLALLKHMNGLSDEAVVTGWAENPYWQYFCGEEHFRHGAPADASSMTRFRQRIGEPGWELVLKETVRAGVDSGTVKESDF